MKASVIIPCYNAETTIRAQLEALGSQDWSEPWEIILVDNGSTDQSLQIARQYEEKLPNFKIVQAKQPWG